MTPKTAGDSQRRNDAKRSVPIWPIKGNRNTAACPHLDQENSPPPMRAADSPRVKRPGVPLAAIRAGQLVASAHLMSQLCRGHFPLSGRRCDIQPDPGMVGRNERRVFRQSHAATSAAPFRRAPIPAGIRAGMLSLEVLVWRSCCIWVSFASQAVARDQASVGARSEALPRWYFF